MRDWKKYVRENLPALGLSGAREHEIVEELAQQLDEAYSEALARGAGVAEAEGRALGQIPDWNALAREIRRAEQSAAAKLAECAPENWHVAVQEENLRKRRGGNMIVDLLQDLRYAMRMMRKNPGFSAIAVLTLALGIGANTALFSVINAILLRTLPVQDPQQLVVLTDPEASGQQSGLQDGERRMLSYHEFEGLRDNNQIFSGIFAFSTSPFNAPVATSAAETGSQTQVSLVSGAYFGVLGVEPQLGRTFSTEVDQGLGEHPQAVLSYAFWQRRMGQDANVAGKTIKIRQTTFDVIGVMPASFTGIVVGNAPDMWVPLTMQMAVTPGTDLLTQPPGRIRRFMFLHVVGRLKPGVNLAQANAATNITFKNLLEVDGSQIADASRRKELTNAFVVVREARHGLSELRGEYQQPLEVLMGLVGLLLLLACANVANLFLARASGRERELAVRVALGSGRARLVRQMLTESVFLSALGAAVGLLLAGWGDSLLLQLVSGSSTPVPLDVHLDATVLAFTAGVMLLAGVLFGLAPALRATRVDLNLVLRGAGRNISGGGQGGSRMPLGKMLVGAQVAISLLLLVTAGLFVRSLQKLTAIPLGYDTAHLIQFRVSPVVDGYKPGAISPLLTQLLAKFNAIPGVRSATLSQNGLFYGGDSGDDITVVGAPVKSGQDMGVAMDDVGPGYFSTLGIPLLAGRNVEDRDTAGTHHLWVNESLAKYFFGEASPVGQHVVIHFSFGDTEYDVVGVVADARPNALRGDIDRRCYISYFDRPIENSDSIFELRTAGDDAAVASAVRRVIHETDAGLSEPVFRTVPGLIDLRLVRDRLTAKLSTFFGLVAMLLACIGLYGVLSYNVARRTGEIGVRMALGAQRSEILRLVLQDVLVVAGIGTVVGLGAALAATRVLASLLYGLTARDPATLAVCAAILLAVAALAAALPAWRASRVDPMNALRYE
ncbi:MAG TPA: ABC transporter permease [Candidatus Acidoferrales bacterium]|nr:ABC transporter permease [Candidatus Acidoferrales bacterium]